MLLALILCFSPAHAGGKFTEKMVVTIPKPEVVIIMNKQNLTPKYDLALEQSFLPKVVESVQQKPF